MTTTIPMSSLPRYTDNRLQTNEPSDRLQSRLLNTYYMANTLIQEQGVNTLFIALGMVVWYESNDSDTERRAPLVLIPVSLERATVRAPFRVKYTDEELGSNISFIEKARTEFGVDLPELHENTEVGAEEIDLEAYFRKVARSIKGMKRWSVDTTSVVLGFFSFSKLLMYRDLDSENWPTGTGPLESKTVRALFEEGFAEPESEIGDEDHLDDHLRPEDTHHVVDADSSQALAISDVANGRNLVIQGPPGTGKSQTITNIIAAAISQNKKVLFVSEKMAALEVVKRRLDDLQLGDACLELHSHKTSKRAVLDELRRTWELGRPDVTGIEDDFVTLTRIQGSLNEYAEAVNTPVGNTGVTPFRAYGELLPTQSLGEDGNSLPRPEIAGMESWSRAVFAEKRTAIANLQHSLGRVGSLKQHLFGGCRLQVVLPSDLAALREKINAAIRSLEVLGAAIRTLSDAMGLRVSKDTTHTGKLLSTAERVVGAPDISGINLGAAEWKNRRDDINQLRDSGIEWAALHAKHDSVLLPDAWGTQLPAIRSTLSKFKTVRLRFFYPEYRRAKKRLSALCRRKLPGGIERQIALTDAIREEPQLRETIERLALVADAALGRQWQAEHTDWKAVGPMINWALNLYDDIDNGKIDPGIIGFLDEDLDTGEIPNLLQSVRDDLDAYTGHLEGVQDALAMDFKKRFGHLDGLAGLPLGEQREILVSWSIRIHEIQDIAVVNNARSVAEKEGLQALTALVEEWPEASDHLTTRFEQLWYEHIVSRAFGERPVLAGFDGSSYEAHREQFREMDTLVLDHNRARVAYAQWEGLPNHNGAGQLRILRREFEKKRRHLPIRQLMERAGNPIQAIKPVFMMSPLSIATYLAPGSVSFDLVVFDEASQVRPVDAIGALLRATQTVVVGDDRQLPPTSFFDAVTHAEDDDDEDDSETADIESILGLLRTAGCPSRMLRWHYRSRHESLITVSNQEFYENRLVVFPSPDSSKEGVGLQYRHLPDTVYDRGRSSTNRQEAQAVARAVMDHARQSPDLTLGVAAFSSAQERAILDELEILRRQDTSCEPFFNAHPEEPFFVKNLENVQGDEREVIFISVGYGRNANGQITMNFGPLNRDGGERRLNVIITRARLRCHVFTNLRADDINLGSTRSLGVRAFKTFLAYAESGSLPANMPVPAEREVDSPFQKAVVSKLRFLGYDAREEVATGGKFIDIGIVDQDNPGRYILGIECDGARYHSSRSARDRDRIREQVLQSLGWRLHRIWSTDWFRNPERELKRAVAAIEQAKAFQPIDGATKPTVKREIQRTDPEEETGDLVIPPYELAQQHVDTLGWQSDYNLGNVPESYLREPIIEIVRVEGPVHFDAVARRIADAAGVSRIGARIRANLERTVNKIVGHKGNGIVRKGEFLWQADMNRPIVRDRSAVPPRVKKIEWIAPEEIAEAITMTVDRSYGIDKADTATEAGRLLGFRRMSKGTRAKVDSVTERLLRDGTLHEDAGHLTLP